VKFDKRQSPRPFLRASLTVSFSTRIFPGAIFTISSPQPSSISDPFVDTLRASNRFPSQLIENWAEPTPKPTTSPYRRTGREKVLPGIAEVSGMRAAMSPAAVPLTTRRLPKVRDESNIRRINFTILSITLFPSFG